MTHTAPTHSPSCLKGQGYDPIVRKWHGTATPLRCCQARRGVPPSFHPHKTPHPHKMQPPRFGLFWKSSETKLDALIWKQCLRSEFYSSLLLHWHLDISVLERPLQWSTQDHVPGYTTVITHTQLAKFILPVGGVRWAHHTEPCCRCSYFFLQQVSIKFFFRKTNHAASGDNGQWT